MQGEAHGYLAVLLFVSIQMKWFVQASELSTLIASRTSVLLFIEEKGNAISAKFNVCHGKQQCRLRALHQEDYVEFS